MLKSQQLLILVEVVYMVVSDLKRFLLCCQKKFLARYVSKNFVSGYSKDYVVPYLSLVRKKSFDFFSEQGEVIKDFTVKFS